MTKLPNNNLPQWTAEEISSRHGMSLAIYQKSRLGARHIAETRQAGITRVELLVHRNHFDSHDHGQVTEVVDECEKQGIDIVAVHGLIPLPYSSEDEEDRKIVMEESLSAIRLAEEVGVPIYVGHFSARKHSKRTVTELLDQTDESGIKLTMENMSGLSGYIAFVDAIGSDRFGMTVDIGHVRDGDGINPLTQKDKARQALAEGGHRIFHVHLHDSIDVKEKPDHMPPLFEGGMIEWGEIFAALKDIDYKGAFVFEDGRGVMIEEWLRLVPAFPKEFVRRYGCA
ncbi:sugar phosphate isomerase/epimerase family protein [Candidatus Poribacteria bacterium]